MVIGYSQPLFRAWARAKAWLLKGSDARTWFVLGFSAWLASVLETGSGSGSNNYNLGGEDRDLFEYGSDALDWVTGLGFGLLVLCLVALALCLAVLVTWISSRMKFVFLDNVVRSEARVGVPWREYSALGDSLFVWRIVFDIIMLVLGGTIVGTGILTTGVAHGVGLESLSLLAIFTFITAMVVFVAVPGAYAHLLLDSFIVPIMYREGVSATEAWRRFLPLLRENVSRFVVYGLFVFMLSIAFAIAQFLVGIATCCIGLLLLMLPYLGTVATLPIWVTYRIFSLEFLAQFGPGYRILPEPPAPPPASPPTPAS